MPPSKLVPCPPRQALLRLQRRLQRRLEQSVRDALGTQSAELTSYEARYQREFRNPRGLVSFDDLALRAASARVILCGDFHSFAQSQRTALRLLRKLAAGPGKLVLAMEMVRRSDQRLLDRYLAGTLDERAFLRAIDYATTWGFDWHHYKPLLDFARTHGLAVQAVNGRDGLSLSERDDCVAETIATAARKLPHHRIYVMMGDLHLAAPHLPRRLRGLLGSQPMLTVFQNNERLYWRLAGQGLEHEAEVIDLGRDRYCVMSGTPWVKVESYLSWLENGEALSSRAVGEGLEEPVDVTDQLLELAETVAGYLGLKGLDLDGFSAYTLDDLSFVAELRQRPALKRLLPHLLQAEVFVLPELDLLYLGRLDVNHLAEAAAEFVHLKASATSLDTDLDGSGRFAARVLRKALAYFGSKLVNPKRRGGLAAAPWPALGAAAETRALAARYARSVLALLGAGELSRSQQRLLDAVSDDDLRLGLAISTRAGRAVGEDLFLAYVRGSMPLGEIRALYQRHHDPRTAWQTLAQVRATVGLVAAER